MMKFVSIMSILLLGVGASGQQTSTVTPSDADKATIIQSVLVAELRNQNSVPDFANVRDVFSQNIEFVEPSQISELGFALVGAADLWQSKNDHVVTYFAVPKYFCSRWGCGGKTVACHRRSTLLRRADFKRTHLYVRSQAVIWRMGRAAIRASRSLPSFCDQTRRSFALNICGRKPIKSLDASGGED